MLEKAWQQEREAAGHMASTVRKQREMDAGAQLTFFFLFRVGFPTSVNPLKKPPFKNAGGDLSPG